MKYILIIMFIMNVNNSANTVELKNIKMQEFNSAIRCNIAKDKILLNKKYNIEVYCVAK